MQSIPLAVLKLKIWWDGHMRFRLHAIHTACGIETRQSRTDISSALNCMQSIPLAVLKLFGAEMEDISLHIACNPYRLRY